MIEVHDQSGESYNINKQIRFKTPMLRFYLCDYRNIYVVGEGPITVQTENNRGIDGYDTNLILKSNVPFIKCTSKFNNVLVNNA